MLAKTIEWPEDRSWVRFHLNPKATFSDGKPVQASDVVWTFNTLINDGAPFYSFYYSGVDHVTADDEHTVTFHFKPGDNRELALIIGQLPVLPEHVWKTRKFTSAGLEKPIGSGPYASAMSIPVNKLPTSAARITGPKTCPSCAVAIISIRFPSIISWMTP